MWTAIHEINQRNWNAIYNFCDGDEFILNVVISVLIMMTIYWSLGSFFTFVDVTGKPAFVIKYKIQDVASNPYPRISSQRIREVVSQVLFNQTIVATPVIAACYYLRRWRGYDNGILLPSPLMLIRDLLIFVLVEEFFFYYSHRCLHHPWVYKHYHKRHHEWTAPVGISAIYCHPVEHVLCNVLPSYLGPVIAGSHVTSLWLWLVMTTPYGVTVHSGYHLPFTPSPESHDFHHVKFNVNYGVIGLLDWLHGTDFLFRQTKAFQRHVVLLSLKPMKQQVPDETRRERGGESSKSDGVPFHTKQKSKLYAIPLSCERPRKSGIALKKPKLFLEELVNWQRKKYPPLSSTNSPIQRISGCLQRA